MFRSSSALTWLFSGILVLVSLTVLTAGCSKKEKDEMKPRESVVQDMEIVPDGDGEESNEESSDE